MHASKSFVLWELIHALAAEAAFFRPPRPPAPEIEAPRPPIPDTPTFLNPARPPISPNLGPVGEGSPAGSPAGSTNLQTNAKLENLENRLEIIGVGLDVTEQIVGVFNGDDGSSSLTVTTTELDSTGKTPALLETRWLYSVPDSLKSHHDRCKRI